MGSGETAPVVVVKLAHSKREDVSVTVTRTMVMVAWHPVPVPGEYVVTASTGYRATFKACQDEGCLTGVRAQCTCSSKTASSGHKRILCHGWHDKRAEEFAWTVLKTFNKQSKKPAVGGSARGIYLPRQYAPCPSWPVERAPVIGGVYFLDGRERPLDYGFDVHALVDGD